MSFGHDIGAHHQCHHCVACMPAADVWTIESEDSGHAPLALFEPYKGKLMKKIAVGFLSHRGLQALVGNRVLTHILHDLRWGLLDY